MSRFRLRNFATLGLSLALHMLVYYYFSDSAEYARLSGVLKSDLPSFIFISLAISVLAFFLSPKPAFLYVLFLCRFFLLYLVSIPLGPLILPKIVLMCVLALEITSYLSPPMAQVAACAATAIFALEQGQKSAWNIVIPQLPPRGLVFLLAFPSLVILLNTYAVALDAMNRKHRERIAQLNDGYKGLMETNVSLQEYAILREDQTLEEERKRYSREVHDSIGYTLVNIILMNKAALKQGTDLAEETRGIFADTIDQAQTGLDETRSALRLLREQRIERPQLRELIRRIQDSLTRSHVEVSFRLDSIFGLGYMPPTFGDKLDAIIYRIIQQSISNAIIHGNADRIDIRLYYKRESLEILIKDNGKGADAIEYGIGIQGMKERLAEVGGMVEIENSRLGFKLSIQVPLGQEHEED
jgi:signal transduction histidine kinase